MIAAGKLTRRVLIQRPETTSQDEHGAPLVTPLEIGDAGKPHDGGEVWAAVEPLSGREVAIGKSYAATVSHKLTIRYRADVDTSCRVLLGSRVFQINAVIDPAERHEELWCYCTEVAR